MLGKGSKYATEAKAGNFIGVDFLPKIDLDGKLPDNWRESNKKLIPEFLKDNPEKSKVAAGLACANTWVVSKGIKIGDIVLCPDGAGTYMIGEVIGEYEYKKGEVLPHRRQVIWVGSIERTAMSQALQNSTGSIGTGAFGETLSTPVLGKPNVGHNQTFISFGDFNSEFEATSLLKYIKTKFARAMLAIMKTTQHNKTKDVWSKVPLQDFTQSSDIDWTKSLPEIDQQLYKKYDLSKDEIDFIESRVKPME